MNAIVENAVDPKTSPEAKTAFERWTFTLESIKARKPCSERYRHLLQALERANVSAPITIEQIVKANGIEDFMWLVTAPDGPRSDFEARLRAEIGEAFFDEEQLTDITRTRRAEMASALRASIYPEAAEKIGELISRVEDAESEWTKLKGRYDATREIWGSISPDATSLRRVFGEISARVFGKEPLDQDGHFDEFLNAKMKQIRREAELFKKSNEAESAAETLFLFLAEERDRKLEELDKAKIALAELAPIELSDESVYLSLLKTAYDDALSRWESAGVPIPSSEVPATANSKVPAKAERAFLIEAEDEAEEDDEV